MRLFLAVDIPEKLREELTPVVYGLQKHGLKAVKPENLHITLKFLGEVEDHQSIERRLKELEYRPFSARSTYISCFGYRTLWLGLESPKMAGLAQEIDKLLPEFESSHDRFRPHLTLARGKDERTKAVFHRWLRRSFSAEWSIDSFVLYSSELTPEGAKYSKLREYKFSL